MPLPEGLQEGERTKAVRPAVLTAGRRRSKAGQSAGRSLNQSSVQELQEQAREAGERASSYKRGGTMRKTKANRGVARLHRGEDIMGPRKKKSRMRGRRGGR